MSGSTVKCTQRFSAGGEVYCLDKDVIVVGKNAPGADGLGYRSECGMQFAFKNGNSARVHPQDLSVFVTGCGDVIPAFF